jgi:hypothetical protein
MKESEIINKKVRWVIISEKVEISFFKFGMRDNKF